MALEGDKIAKPQFDLKLFWRLFSFGTPYINLIILGVFLIVLSSVAYILNPYIIKLAIDDYILPGDMSGLRGITLIFLGIILLQAFMAFLQGFCTQCEPDPLLGVPGQELHQAVIPGVVGITLMMPLILWDGSFIKRKKLIKYLSGMPITSI